MSRLYSSSCSCSWWRCSRFTDAANVQPVRARVSAHAWTRSDGAPLSPHGRCCLTWLLNCSSVTNSLSHGSQRLSPVVADADVDANEDGCWCAPRMPPRCAPKWLLLKRPRPRAAVAAAIAGGKNGIAAPGTNGIGVGCCGCSACCCRRSSSRCCCCWISCRCCAMNAASKSACSFVGARCGTVTDSGGGGGGTCNGGIATACSRAGGGGGSVTAPPSCGGHATGATTACGQNAPPTNGACG